MEKDKNNKGIIPSLIIIIIMLLIVIALLVTTVIHFKNNSANVNENNIINNNGEITNNLTKEEATNIVKNIFTNSTVQYLVDFISVTYCKTDPTPVSEEELGLNHKWNGYHKCTDFNSYEELTNYFKQYVTEEYYNNLLLKQSYLREKNTMTDGSISYNYYEKDGNLYAANTGKGSNMNKIKLLENEVVYKIDSFDNSKITATITAKWNDAGDNIYKEEEKMELINDNGIWKVNSYESTQIK